LNESIVFKYLGTLITTRYDTSAEINNRITLANRSYFGMMNMRKAKNINRKHKVTMYVQNINKTSSDVWGGNLGPEQGG